MPNRLIILFLDGVGIGDDNPEINPLVGGELSFFREVLGTPPVLGNPYLTRDEDVCFPVDAVLNVPGIPQSGTGQISLLCGVNAQKLLGNHFGPFPHTTQRPLLEQESIFSAVPLTGKKIFYANAFPKIYFDIAKKRLQAYGSIAYAAKFSGHRLNTPADVRAGKAVTAELTNARWNARLGYKLPVITPGQAAKRLLRRSSEFDVTFYEYYLTDFIGHGRVKDESVILLQQLNSFLHAVREGVRKNGDTMVICSDHGNLEDISAKGHTRNPAIGFATGSGAPFFMERFRSLDSFKHAVLDWLTA